MTENLRVLSYCSSRLSDGRASSICNQLEAELPVEIQRVKSIQDYFPLLSQSSFHVDFILLDVDDIYAMEGIDGFDIIKSLYTIINCTVYRDEKTIKVVKRNTKLVAMVSDTTPSVILNEILSMDEIKHLTLKVSNNIDISLVKKAVTNCINNGEKAPKFMLDAVKQKPSVKQDQNSIHLTSRQQQVLKMVIERGASNKIIAKTLKIAESTVKLHLSTIMKKYKVRNRTQLAVFAKNDTSSTRV